jgi:hypothetical protein
MIKDKNEAEYEGNEAIQCASVPFLKNPSGKNKVNYKKPA